VKGPAHEGQTGRPDSRDQNNGSGAQTLGSLIKSSEDVRVQELKTQIDLLKKQRSDQMGRIRECQRRLNYKSTEQEAITQLLEMERQKEKSGKPRPIMGKLKRQRHALEFKVSTEAPSLAQEKAFVRKINELNAQIEEGMKLERMERKKGLVAKDIVEFQTRLNALVAEIVQTDTKLDELYASVRRILGIGRQRPKEQGQSRPKPQQRQAEINLEDIVVIKKKDAKGSVPAAQENI